MVRMRSAVGAGRDSFARVEAVAVYAIDVSGAFNEAADADGRPIFVSHTTLVALGRGGALGPVL